MAQNPPSPIDVTDIQFKVHDKFSVFNAGKLRSSLNLLATASNFGLMFVGNPNEAELKVILVRDIVEYNVNSRSLQARQVQLPNMPNCIAVSCDGSMLAVNYTQNGFGFVAIYSVPSFTTSNIKSLYNIRLPGDENIKALQLLWNPVISGSLAVVMSNGALGMYDFKNNSYEFHTLDSKEQIHCGSWSPKGKQIVLGFPNGKLAQYKPDLKLARTIECPPNIHPGPFITISIQWLSTFQFAVVFLQQGDEVSPSLYIVHAPKVGAATYTTYNDICYSSTGPRAQQVNLMHIQPWNLLLVTSANGVEVGILGTKETIEAPTWVQYTLLDEARIEMPLTEDKDETYPIGFALDTSSTHQLVIAEKTMPIMPMIHVLSTHGQLVTFNFLNLQPNTPNICSPSSPPLDTSGMSQFKSVSEMLNQKKTEITIPATTMLQPTTVVSQTAPVELSSAPLEATAKPAVEKPKSIFGTSAIQQSTITSNMFGAPNSVFGNPSSVVSGASSLFKTTAPVNNAQISIGFGATDIKKQSEQPVATSTNIVNADKSKPLYTVPPTFTAASAVVSGPTVQQQPGKLPSVSANEVDDIVSEMISAQISSFDLELKKLASQSKGLLNNIGSTDKMKGYTKRLNDLQEIVDQANEREFESDLQSLRNLLNESYAMVAECRSKLNMYNNPDIAKLTSTLNCNPVNRRQLAKLNSYLASNQAQLQVIHNQIDAQWSTFQDQVKRNSRTQMHTPCLEGIYQSMTKVKDRLARERTKLNFIKSKLKEKGLLYNQSQNNTKSDVTMESLTDTILSMSLASTVEEGRAKLTKEKLAAIRKLLSNRNITTVKPQRPDRVGLKSEVILETKLKTDRKIRDGAATNIDKMEQERIKTEQQRILTKPTATKAIPQGMTVISQPNAPTSFSFGGVSPFVKPSPAKPEDHKKEQPAIVKPVASTAAPMYLKQTTPSTAATSSAFSGFGVPPNVNPTFAGFSMAPNKTATYTGFEGNSAVSFGSPKPMMAKESSNIDNAPKEQTAAISFAPKPMTTEAKPFTSSSFSSPFTAVISKSTAVANKENKMSDNKPFMPVATKSDIPSNPVFSSAQPKGFDASTSVSNAFSFGGANATSRDTTAGSSAPFSFPFASALNSGADSKSVFGGIAKSTPTSIPSAIKSDILPDVTVTQTKSDTTEPSTEESGFTFTSLNLGTLGLPATPDLSPTPSVSTVDSTSQSSAATVKTSSASISDPTDSLFAGLNVCKPTSTENGSFKPAFGGGNIFKGVDSAKDWGLEISSTFGSTSVSKESSVFTGFSSMTDSIKSPFEATTASTTEAPAAANAVPASTTSAQSVFGTNTTQTFTFGTPSATTVPGSIVTGQVTSSSTASSVFSTPPAGTSIFAAASTSIPPTTSGGAPLFGGHDFGTPTSPQTTVSIFGSTMPSAVISPPGVVAPFGGAISAMTSGAPVAAPPFGAAASTSSGSIFAAAISTPAVSSSSVGLFAGIPKPDQSVFGQPEGNLFGSPSADNSASGGSLFGGQTASFGAQPNSPSGPSIFGGSSAGSGQIATQFGAAPNNSNGNIFGNPIQSAAPNVFGAPAQSTCASGGSIFDQSSTAGQSGGSLFGGAGAQSGFATSNSPFRANASSGASIFGGSGSATPPKPSAFSSPPATSTFGASNTGGFGLFSQTPAFGSPTQPAPNSGSGSFAHGGTSIAQTGFASPSSGAAFAKPVFGVAPAFGGAPSFGSPPSFGSTSTFGSPKGFGSFAAPAAAAGAFTSPTFEALGSTDQGLSFGKLAQNTNANQQKPAFGGSSFMSYRS